MAHENTTRRGKTTSLADELPRLELPPPPPGYFERQEREAATRAAEREREKREERIRQQLAWGAPLADLLAIEAGLAETRARALVAEWSAAGEVFLLLQGRRGRGKTTAATEWLVEPHSDRVPRYLAPPRFVTAFELERLDRFDDAVMQSLELARKLVIDDPGREYADTKGALSSKVNGLVDARDKHRLPTVITTNLSVADLTTRYGPRIVELVEHSGWIAVAEGPDLRRARAQGVP